MGKEILRVSPDYTMISDFTPQSAGSDTYKKVYYTDGKKSVKLYDFMNELCNKEGTIYTWDSIPFINSSNIVKTDNICELPPSLLYIFSKYKSGAIYYPLTTDLRGYVAPVSGSNVDLSVFNDKASLKNLRINYTSYNDESNYTLEVPGFYDGITSHYIDNKFKYECNIDSNIIRKDTEFFFCENTYTSKADTTLELNVSLLDSSVTFDTYNNYCLSFYVRKDTESDSIGNITVYYVNNDKDIEVNTYIDSLGKHTDKAVFSNVWEHISCTFSSTDLDINKSSIVLKIKMPVNTIVGGFLLEEDKFGEGSIYFKTILNEKPVKYHIPSVWLKTYSAESNTYITKNLTDKDWTIIYTKTSGITISKEVIGNIILTEGLDDSDTRYLSITEGSTIMKRKILDTESNAKNYSKRTYYLSYVNSTEILEVNIYQNGERLKLVDDTDTENNIFRISSDNFEYKIFSRDNPKSPNSKIYQHILLGGESRENLYPCARYCDLIYIDSYALSFKEIDKYGKNMMLIKDIPFTAEYSNVVKTPDGATATSQAEEIISKAASIITSLAVVKNTALILKN